MGSMRKVVKIEWDRTPESAENVIESAFFEYSEMETRLTIVSC